MLPKQYTHAVFPVFLSLFLASQGFATPRNVTIDDETGDAVTGFKPIYSPPIAWNQGAGCDFCAAKPNTSEAGGGTWHDGTYIPGRYPEQFDFTLQFNGTAIWIFNIVQSLNFVALNFTLDGEDAGSFVWDNASSLGFLYNQSVFARDGLEQRMHTVVATASGSNQSTVLFDYAIYTTDPDPTNTTSSTGASGSSTSTSPTPPSSANTTSSSHSAPIGPIVGGVLGGLALISFVALVLFCYHRRNTKRKPIQPYIASPTEPSPTTPSKVPTPTYYSAPILRHPDTVTDSTSTTAPETTVRSESSPLSDSVIDIRPRVPPASPTADTQSTVSMSSAQRERQLAEEVERLRSEMRAMREGRPPPVLPDYEQAQGDVLIYRE